MSTEFFERLKEEGLDPSIGQGDGATFENDENFDGDPMLENDATFDGNAGMTIDRVICADGQPYVYDTVNVLEDCLNFSGWEQPSTPLPND